jgi:hypothetical protein
MRNAEQDFVKKNFDSACRKYEEVSNEFLHLSNF